LDDKQRVVALQVALKNMVFLSLSLPFVRVNEEISKPIRTEKKTAERSREESSQNNEKHHRHHHYWESKVDLQHSFVRAREDENDSDPTNDNDDEDDDDDER
jgi:hypothetical protein